MQLTVRLSRILAPRAARSRPAGHATRQSIVWLAVVLLPGLWACGENLGPDRGDPARFAFATSLVFACGGWYPQAPDVETGLFDIVTRRTESDPADRPTTAEIRAIVRAGGTIVYQFHVAKVRAILPVASARTLGRKLVAVTDPRRVEDSVAVGFRQRIAEEAVTRLGGTLVARLDNSRTVYASIPDPFAPHLRADERVEYVESTEDMVCLL